MSWNEGYRTDIAYSYGYYGDFNPANIRLCLNMAGMRAPDTTHACELGYGQGVSLNIHAAAGGASWTGTDFNPSQVVFAREMAAASGAQAECHADSFHDFCARTDLPEFDYIVLHGIWSWISPENRQAIMRLIRDRLAIGGVVYISYNTFPGWAAFAPARELLRQYAETQESPNLPITDRIERAYGFMQDLIRLNAAYFRDNPSVRQRVERFSQSSRTYLAHEFFNKDWHPCSFAELAAMFQEARLSFACEAFPLYAVPNLGLSREQSDFIENIQDPVLRQTIMDFLRNTRFRKDIWIKGPIILSERRRKELLLESRFILSAPPDKITRTLRTQAGEITLSEASHAITAAVFSDGKIHTLSDCVRHMQTLARSSNPPAGLENESWQSLLTAIAVLIGAGLLMPAQSPDMAAKTRGACLKLNSFIASGAIDSNNIGVMASPVTGGGIGMSRFAQLFWLAVRRGAKTSDQLGAFVYDALESAGQQISNDGAPITSRSEAVAYLESQAREFLHVSLPLLKNLLIA